MFSSNLTVWLSRLPRYIPIYRSWVGVCNTFRVTGAFCPPPIYYRRIEGRGGSEGEETFAHKYVLPSSPFVLKQRNRRRRCQVRWDYGGSWTKQKHVPYWNSQAHSMFLACHGRFMPLRNVQGMFALLMLHCIRLLTLYASKKILQITSYTDRNGKCDYCPHSLITWQLPNNSAVFVFVEDKILGDVASH